MGRRAINAIETLKRGGAIEVSLRPVSTAIDYDAGEGSVNPEGADGVNDVPRTALLLDMLTSRPLSGFGHMDGLKSDIEGVRKWAFMDGVGLVPKVQDQVYANFVGYNVLNVQTIADKDGPIVHVLALSF